MSRSPVPPGYDAVCRQCGLAYTFMDAAAAWGPQQMAPGSYLRLNLSKPWTRFCSKLCLHRFRRPATRDQPTPPVKVTEGA